MRCGHAEARAPHDDEVVVGAVFENCQEKSNKKSMPHIGVSGRAPDADGGAVSS
jgi:hypothetical protein